MNMPPLSTSKLKFLYCLIKQVVLHDQPLTNQHKAVLGTTIKKSSIFHLEKQVLGIHKKNYVDFNFRTLKDLWS